MSRGPGRWQRALLAALEEYRLVEVHALAWHHLDREPTRSELVAVRRAARSIATSGRASAFYLAQCRGCHESYPRWRTCCPAVGMGQVLVLTTDTTLSSMAPAFMKPKWLSVAADPNDAGATHTAVARTVLPAQRLGGVA